jgi:hypothetical protein
MKRLFDAGWIEADIRVGIIAVPLAQRQGYGMDRFYDFPAACAGIVEPGRLVL